MKRTLMLAALTAAGTGSAFAQSSVSLYGIIDAGISYVNHAATTNGSGKNFKYDDGVAQGSRWGLRGTEDLGAGLSAIFTLENGFNSGTGVSGQGGAEFGRQAFVGLSQRNVGSLTLGRQYSLSTDYLGQMSGGSNTVSGNYAFHINDLDQLTSSRINNAIKISSADFSGFRFGALYGFSNAAGAFGGANATTSGGTTTAGSSRTYSFGATYSHGPFSAAAAYTDIRYPAQSSPAFSVSIANVNTLGIRDLRTFGVGGKYAIGQALVFGLWTHTRFEPLTAETSNLNIFEGGVKYNLTPVLSLAGSYTYSHLTGNADGKWHQGNLSIDYALSKRTDIYVLGVYQKALGTNNGVPVQAEIGSSTSFFGSSGRGSTSQVAARIGIRHRF